MEVFTNILWLIVVMSQIAAIAMAADGFFKLDDKQKWVCFVVFVASFGGLVAVLRNVWRLF